MPSQRELLSFLGVTPRATTTASQTRGGGRKRQLTAAQKESAKRYTGRGAGGQSGEDWAKNG
ncbi:MAG: hypothetical protein ABSE73_12800 [Planctomycetota bacterium]